MNKHAINSWTRRLILTVGLCIAASGAAFAVTTAFTYQGQLTDRGLPANGLYSMQFTLFDLAAGGRQLGPVLHRAPVQVSGGFFSTTLDFDVQVFADTNRWLEIRVGTNSTDVVFTVLSPRQQLLPV